MRRSRFSEEQIIGILKEDAAGVAVTDLCPKHGVSDASIYNWKARLGGIEVSEARRLKVLEGENTRLKSLLADATLDNAALANLGQINGGVRSQPESCRSPEGCLWDEKTGGV